MWHVGQCKFAHVIVAAAGIAAITRTTVWFFMPFSSGHAQSGRLHVKLGRLLRGPVESRHKPSCTSRVWLRAAFGPLVPPLQEVAGEDLPTDRLVELGFRIDALVADSKTKQACEFFSEFQFPDTGSSQLQPYLEALADCGANGGSERVKEIVEYLWENPGLDPTLDCFSAGIKACLQAQDIEAATEFLNEVQSWGLSRAAPLRTRFEVAPWIKWDQELRKAGCSIRNELQWTSEGPAPEAPQQPCWLVPSQDDMAEAIARRSQELELKGWTVCRNNATLVRALRNKAELYTLAQSLGLDDFMPLKFDCEQLDAATYPCVLKPAVGTWGSDMAMVHNSEDAQRFLAKCKVPRELMVLQEMVEGHLEYSTTLLVVNGSIYDHVCTRYEYDRETYIWPDVKELGHSCHSVPEHHLRTMAAFLPSYDGILNFNYKVRKSGDMCIFETNPRVGADFALDVPRPRMRHLFEKMDALLK